MCGVVGFWNRDGQVASEVLLERMLERIRHRGPDDKGTWTQSGVGLGQARLSILDLSKLGHQPFLTADGKGVISYNGEVYNFKDLRKDLEKEGVKFKSATDTEVILYALHRWGPEKAIKLFNGMFAFAYFNLRDQTLWLARDRMGIKPLYFSRVENMIAFGSEIKALFGHPSIPCRPDMHALTTQMIHQRLDGSWTAFENIESIIPGTIVKIRIDSEEVIQYFDLLQDLDVEQIIKNSKISFETLIDNFEQHFASSVKAHLISDAPLATMSSGGVDSSFITAIAKEYKSDIVAYVADVKRIDVPEIGRARKVCDHLGVELRSVEVDQEDYLRLWPMTVYQNDQPNYYAQNVPFMAVAQTAHRDGFKVLLTGEGADELFGGYAWHVEAYEMWRLRRFHSKFLPNIAPFRMFGRFMSKFLPLDMDELTKRPFKHISKWFLSDDAREFCGIDGGQRAFREEALFHKLGKINPVEERAFLARSFEDFYCHLRNILISNDKMGMAHSIEARVPFLENALINFAMHLPPRAKYHKGITKFIVKKAAERKLPHDIIYAPKIGFGVSHHVWRNTKYFVQNGIIAELFKWSRDERERICNLIFSDHLMPFHFVSMELWARIYFRNDSLSGLGEQLVNMAKVGTAVLK